MNGKRFRVDGGGQKLTDVELEEEVLSWIQQRRWNMLRASRKLIIFKAKSIYNEKCGDNEELKAGFIASNGWLMKFMKWNSLSMRRRKTIAQTQPARDVPGTSPEGPLKVLTSGTSRGPSGDSQGTNAKIDDLMKKLFFRCNSPCFTHLFLIFTGKTNIEKV